MRQVIVEGDERVINKSLLILAILAVVLLLGSCVGGGFYAGALYTNMSHYASISAPDVATAPNPVILKLSGNGDKSTQSFTTHDTWSIQWTCGAPGHIYIIIYDTKTGLGVLNYVGYTCPGKGTRDESVYHLSGNFYLSISTKIPWEVTVSNMS